MDVRVPRKHLLAVFVANLVVSVALALAVFGGGVSAGGAGAQSEQSTTARSAP